MTPGSQSQAAIEFRNVTFSYANMATLEDVSIVIPRGQLTIIVGPNGGGKTTFFKLTLGLLKPIQGEVRVFDSPADQARPRIGYVPQHFNFDPFFPVSVEDVVLMGRLGSAHRAFGFFSETDRQRKDQALKDVDLEELAKRPFSDLSGGQRQRVLIARALVTEPSLLLLDEPTANLDPATQKDFYELIYRLAERMTVVLITHNMNYVTAKVEKVICINRFVVEHPTGEVPEASCTDHQVNGLKIVHHDRQLFLRSPRDPG